MVLASSQNAFVISAFVIAISCGSVSAGGLNAPEFEGAVSVGGVGSESAAAAQLVERAARYQAAADEARKKGLWLGVAQGALMLGAVSGDLGVAVVGGVLGGFVGRYSADVSASSLILEHQNYLVRRQSLEEVLLAAKVDRKNTAIDLALTKDFLKHRELASVQELTPDVASSLFELHSVAVTRMVTLQELVPQFSGSEESLRLIKSELQAQGKLIEEFRSVLEVKR